MLKQLKNKAEEVYAGLKAEFWPTGEVEDLSVSGWRRAVADEATMLGYWAWKDTYQ